jgi:hypothetical protein
MSAASINLSDLYLEDETAWLELMAQRIEAGQLDEIDYANLQEYLRDMARRDRREVRSRLIVLLAHLLKWVAQPDRRSGSWLGSIIEQRQELAGLASQGVLRNYAEEVLGEAYVEALERASAETGLPLERFPDDCPYEFKDLLAIDPTAIA